MNGETPKEEKRRKLHQTITIIGVPLTTTILTVGVAFAGWLALQLIAHGEALSTLVEWTKNADQRLEKLEAEEKENRSSIEEIRRELPDDIERRIRRAIDRMRE